MNYMTTLYFQKIDLKPAQLKAVVKKARAEGKTPPEYVRTLIERDLLADHSFDEILKPIRDDIRKSGITEEQFDAVIERARDTTRRKPRRTQ